MVTPKSSPAPPMSSAPLNSVSKVSDTVDDNKASTKSKPSQNARWGKCNCNIQRGWHSSAETVISSILPHLYSRYWNRVEAAYQLRPTLSRSHQGDLGTTTSYGLPVQTRAMQGWEDHRLRKRHFVYNQLKRVSHQWHRACIISLR